MTSRKQNNFSHNASPARVSKDLHASMGFAFLSRERFSNTSLTGDGSKNISPVCGASLNAAVAASHRDTTPRCAAALRVRSIVLSGVGLRSCQANQASGGSCGPVRTSEQLFQESSAQQIFPHSAASSAPSGPTSRRSTWRSAPASRSAARNISSTGSVSRTPVRRLPSMPRLSAESWLEGEPRECDGSAWDRLPPLVRASGREGRA